MQGCGRAASQVGAEQLSQLHVAGNVREGDLGERSGRVTALLSMALPWQGAGGAGWPDSQLTSALLSLLLG